MKEQRLEKGKKKKNYPQTRGQVSFPSSCFYLCTDFSLSCREDKTPEEGMYTPSCILRGRQSMDWLTRTCIASTHPARRPFHEPDLSHTRTLHSCPTLITVLRNVMVADFSILPSASEPVYISLSSLSPRPNPRLITHFLPSFLL